MPHLIENILKTLLRQGRALHVFDCTQFPGKMFARLSWNRPLFLPCKRLYDSTVISQIDLRPDDEAWYPRAVMVHLWEPLLLDVFERGGRGYAEAHEKHNRLVR